MRTILGRLINNRLCVEEWVVLRFVCANPRVPSSKSVSNAAWMVVFGQYALHQIMMIGALGSLNAMLPFNIINAALFFYNWLFV